MSGKGPTGFGLCDGLVHIVKVPLVHHSVVLVDAEDRPVVGLFGHRVVMNQTVQSGDQVSTQETLLRVLHLVDRTLPIITPLVSLTLSTVLVATTLVVAHIPLSVALAISLIIVGKNFSSHIPIVKTVASSIEPETLDTVEKCSESKNYCESSCFLHNF